MIFRVNWHWVSLPFPSVFTPCQFSLFRCVGHCLALCHHYDFKINLTHLSTYVGLSTKRCPRESCQIYLTIICAYVLSRPIREISCVKVRPFLYILIIFFHEDQDDNYLSPVNSHSVCAICLSYLVKFVQWNPMSNVTTGKCCQESGTVCSKCRRLAVAAAFGTFRYVLCSCDTGQN